ncbi:recombinase family protein [Bosea sp. (in: a-proteobacteria)]|uniref:recombinase family protein n=1 Tax=Bosea sp. (in: a-proteobacteria) TaxID=1871050 RepID=UPI004033E5F6
MNRALGYTRVSSDEQGRSGFGLDAQRAEIEEFARQFGYRVTSWESDVASAIGGNSLTRRPGLQAILDKAKRQRRPIIVSRLDRISRDSSELERLVRESGVEFISINDGYLSDPLVLKTLKVQARRIEQETLAFKKRTREGLERAKEQGRIGGNTTNLSEAQQLGQEANRKKFENQCKELEPLITEIRETGPKSGAAIAKELNARGVRSSSGKSWTGPNLRRYLVEIDSWAKAEAEVDEHYRDHQLFGRF